MARCPKWLVVLALTISLGGHWAMLQSVAWVGMLISYSQESPFTVAISKTFDGKNPCGLCKEIQQRRAEEGKQHQDSAKSCKLDFAVPWLVATFRFEIRPDRIPSQDEFPDVQMWAPPKPRPRCFSAGNLV